MQEDMLIQISNKIKERKKYYGAALQEINNDALIENNLIPKYSEK